MILSLYTYAHVHATVGRWVKGTYTFSPLLYSTRRVVCANHDGDDGAFDVEYDQLTIAVGQRLNALGIIARVPPLSAL